MKTKLGTGTLTWDRVERVSDRYGAVYLIPDQHNSLTEIHSPSLIDADQCRPLIGCVGILTAVVRLARDSTHVGDHFHCIWPRKPKAGQPITFGKGSLQLSRNAADEFQVELHPLDGRQTQWMDLRALYDAHEQTVDLYFEQEGDAS